MKLMGHRDLLTMYRFCDCFRCIGRKASFRQTDLPSPVTRGKNHVKLTPAHPLLGDLLKVFIGMKEIVLQPLQRNRKIKTYI